MTAEEKLLRTHEIAAKYSRLTTLGKALIGMSLIEEYDRLINDPDLVFMKDILRNSWSILTA